MKTYALIRLQKTFFLLAIPILSYSMQAKAEIVIPALDRVANAPVPSPALSGICGRFVEVATGILDPHKASDLPGYMNLITNPTDPSVSASGRFYLSSMDVANHQTNPPCVAEGDFPGGASWPIAPMTGSTAGARFEGFINIPGTSGTPVRWTFGFSGNDAARFTIGSKEFATLQWDTVGNWKRFEWVSFEEPGVYPFVVEWSTNHSCGIDPLEVSYATKQVPAYDQIDCKNQSVQGTACATNLLPTSDFQILGSPLLMQKEDGSYPTNGIDTDQDGLDDGLEKGFCGVGILDSDGDGILDFQDKDDDGDSVLTKYEDINTNGNFTDDDTDGDGKPNYLDADDDGDGLLTKWEGIAGDGDSGNVRDTDGDGIPNYLDDDDDNDDVLTRNEQADLNMDGDPADAIDLNKNGVRDYLDKSAFPGDTDQDGLYDYEEDINHDGNLENDDTDKDGTPNYKDPDDDGDGLPTKDEGGTGDLDKDGILDYLDGDDDNDGTLTKLELSDGNHDGVPDYLQKNVRAGVLYTATLGGGLVACAAHPHTAHAGKSILWAMLMVGIVIFGRRKRK